MVYVASLYDGAMTQAGSEKAGGRVPKAEEVP
jgi:hypothetical protein